MDSRFQSSFIPKKPVDTGALRPSGDINIFLILSILILIITGAAAAGVFVYRVSLEKKNTENAAKLEEVKKSFGLSDIQVLKDRSRQLEAIKAILASHSTALPLFHLIESNTLKNVRFKTFAYSNKDGKATLSLAGEARSFNSVAYQSQVFTAIKEFTSPVFSGFNLADAGSVSFNFTSGIQPELLKYTLNLNLANDNASGEANESENGGSFTP